MSEAITIDDLHPDKFPNAGSATLAVFNCNEYAQKLGRDAVRKKYGKKGWAKVRGCMKTGVMELFRYKPTKESMLYVYTVASAVERRMAKKKARREQANDQ